MDTEKIFKVLSEIQAQVPKNLREAAVKEVPFTPHLKELVEKALIDDGVPEAKKEELRKLKESGDLDKTFPVENKEVTKLIDQFVARKINKAIKEGRLPPRSKIEDIKGLKEMYAKVHAQENSKQQNKGKDRA